jgi:hypothetical protein
MKNKTVYFAVALLTTSCASSPKHYAVFDYEDFGPQSMAWEKIGMQWWQWDNHGDSASDYKYDVKVIVYRNIPLERIKALFPVDKSNKKDFRYFEYHDSIYYLNKQIDSLESIPQGWAFSLKERLELTKELVQKLK